MDFPKNSNVVIIRLIHLKKKKNPKTSSVITVDLKLCMACKEFAPNNFNTIISKYIHSAF